MEELLQVKEILSNYTDEMLLLFNNLIEQIDLLIEKQDKKDIKSLEN